MYFSMYSFREIDVVKSILNWRSGRNFPQYFVKFSSSLHQICYWTWSWCFISLDWVPHKSAQENPFVSWGRKWIYICDFHVWLIQVTVRSKAWVCSRLIAGPWFRIPLRRLYSSLVFIVCCAGRGLCYRLITSKEESYQACACVCVFVPTKVVPKVMSNFFFACELRRAVVGGTSCRVILQCLVTSIACITWPVSLLT